MATTKAWGSYMRVEVCQIAQDIMGPFSFVAHGEDAGLDGYMVEKGLMARHSKVAAAGRGCHQEYCRQTPAGLIQCPFANRSCQNANYLCCRPWYQGLKPPQVNLREFRYLLKLSKLSKFS